MQRRQISYIREAMIAVKNSAACQTDKFAAVKMCRQDGWMMMQFNFSAVAAAVDYDDN